MNDKTEVSAVEIENAARAGLSLLQDPDLRVPLQVAQAGHYDVLKMLLSGIITGQIALSTPNQEVVGEVVEEDDHAEG